MDIGIAQKRAVVGGTGKYRGIKGEVTTTRNEDGTYKHVLDVKMAN
jgi:alpha-D-ribose 1-methylphosphonate 5-triphosphate synthase subunit PhnG